MRADGAATNPGPPTSFTIDRYGGATKLPSPSLFWPLILGSLSGDHIAKVASVSGALAQEELDERILEENHRRRCRGSDP
jgi:hypothetical protein